MNWLDNYIRNNGGGYLINKEGGLFVRINGDWVRHVKGDSEPEDLREIDRDEFIDLLLAR